MHDETFEQITQLSNERFNLYRLAGREHLTADQQGRINTLTDRLAVLWDQHRRELASAQRAKPLRNNYSDAA
jgi:hypothetical protein